MRKADCSIAMAHGSQAARQAAQVVLLDSDFTALPHILLEGRRVVNNMTRVAGVFFVKTIYSRSEERRVGKECRSRWSPYH